MGVESGVNEGELWCEGGAKQPIAIPGALYGEVFSVRGPRAGTVSVPTVL